MYERVCVMCRCVSLCVCVDILVCAGVLCVRVYGFGTCVCVCVCVRVCVFMGYYLVAQSVSVLVEFQRRQCTGALCWHSIVRQEPYHKIKTIDHGIGRRNLECPECKKSA